MGKKLSSIILSSLLLASQISRAEPWTKRIYQGNSMEAIFGNPALGTRHGKKQPLISSDLNYEFSKDLPSDLNPLENFMWRFEEKLNKNRFYYRFNEYEDEGFLYEELAWSGFWRTVNDRSEFARKIDGKIQEVNDNLTLEYNSSRGVGLGIEPSISDSQELDRNGIRLEVKNLYAGVLVSSRVTPAIKTFSLSKSFKGMTLKFVSSFDKHEDPTHAIYYYGIF
jgi:hypothetical protein